MKKRTFTSQRGSSPLMVLGVALVLASLGLGGWYVWQRSHKTNPQQAKTNQQQKTGEGSRKESADSQPDPTQGGKYLVIDEWGVKLPLSEGISTAYYAFSSEGGVDYVALYDGAFDALENTKGTPCGGSNVYQFYAISRMRAENMSTFRQETGPAYREFPFDKEYVYSGLGAHQAPPACANLNPDPYGEFQDDQNILIIANDKEQAFDRAFGSLRRAD